VQFSVKFRLVPVRMLLGFTGDQNPVCVQNLFLVLCVFFSVSQKHVTLSQWQLEFVRFVTFYFCYKGFIHKFYKFLRLSIH
jgi:hypothetical protein